MTFTGGLGERYCSQKCYDAGGATVTKHLLRKWTGDCSVCRGPVYLHVGSREGMVCWKPGDFLFHCGSPSCVEIVRNHVQQTDVCAICGTPLANDKNQEQQQAEQKREEDNRQGLQTSEMSHSTKNTFEDAFEDMSQKIADQIIKQITQYTQIWSKVLQQRFTIEHNIIDETLLKNIVCDIGRYLFSACKDNRFTDQTLETFVNLIDKKIQTGLSLKISDDEANSFFERQKEEIEKGSSDFEKHKNKINTLFVPIYQYMTGQSEKEISDWAENDGVALFSLYFVFYNDIKLIVGNVLNNEYLIKDANKNRKSWLSKVNTEIYPHEFKKGCFIATAVYNSSSASEVIILRRFRDQVMLRWLLGQKFVDWYYRTAPRLASIIIKRALIKKIIRYLLFTLVLSAKVINNKMNNTGK